MAFVITQVVEIPVYERALRLSAPGRERSLWLRLAIAAAASTITHPVVWFVIPRLEPWALYAVVAETFAVAAETLWLRWFGVERAFWWALLANALSVGIGVLVRNTVGWL
jgi:hypothetical protein